MTSSQENSSNRPVGATIILDNNDVVTSWNQTAESLLGYSATEAVGKHISALAPRELLALPGIDQIKQHSKFFDNYSRYHIVGNKSDRFFLAEVAAHVESGPDAECLAVIHITPAEPGSRSLVGVDSTKTPQLPPGNDLLHECSNLMMVLLGQAEMLKDGAGKDRELGQHVKHLVEAASRMVEVWPKLRELLELGAGREGNEASCGAGQPGQLNNPRMAILARVAALSRR